MAAGASPPSAAVIPCFAPFAPAQFLPRNRPRRVHGGERGSADLLLLSFGMALASPGPKRCAAGQPRQCGVARLPRDDLTRWEEDQAGVFSFFSLDRSLIHCHQNVSAG